MTLSHYIKMPTLSVVINICDVPLVMKDKFVTTTLRLMMKKNTTYLRNIDLSQLLN